jgi:uncharacterized membrane protein
MADDVGIQAELSASTPPWSGPAPELSNGLAAVVARLDRVHGKLGLAAPIGFTIAFPLLAPFLFVLSGSILDETAGGMFPWIVFTVLWALVGLLFLDMIAVLVGAAGHASRRKRMRQEAQVRIQSLKDWFLRGDIEEDDYERLKASIEEFARANTVGARSRRAATTLGGIAILMVMPALVAAIFASLGVLFAIVDGDAESMLVFAVAAPIFLLVAVKLVLAARFGTRLRKEAKAHLASERMELDRVEEDVLRASRPGGTTRRRTSMGPTMRSYG